MHAHRHRTTRSLGLLAAVFLVIGTASTITRIPAGGELHAQTTWRGLVVAPEQRCLPYDADDYRYPQSVEDRIVAGLGGVYGPYTGRWWWGLSFGGRPPIRPSLRAASRPALVRSLSIARSNSANAPTICIIHPTPRAWWCSTASLRLRKPAWRSCTRARSR